MLLLILLPVLSFIFLWIFLYSYNKYLHKSLRESFIDTTVLLATLLLVSTEVLSIFDAINFINITFFWVMLAVLSLTFAFYHQSFQTFFQDLRQRKYQITTLEKFIVLSVFILVVFLAFLAFIFPPNNWDSMTYHMSRVMHWIDNQSVKHYPTHIIRQLFSAPFAEFVILHFQILTANDFFAQFVQWFSMLNSLLVVSLIAKMLGASRSGQIYAILFCATIPIGIYEATSTQNDYVVSFFISFTVYYFLKLAQKYHFSAILKISFGLALAINTKATAFVFLTPVVFAYLFLMLRTNFWELFKNGFLISIIVLVINTGFFYRNYQLYGEPLGTTESKTYGTTNQTFGVWVTYSNLTKNIAFNFGTENMALNRFVYNVTLGLNRIFNIDINDERIITKKFIIPNSNLLYSEDYAPNPLHTSLIILALILYLVCKMYQKYLLNIFVIIWLAMLLVFSGILMWQHFITRLQLPLFVVATPCIAFVLEKQLSSVKFREIFVGCFLIFISYQTYLQINNAGNKPIMAISKVLANPRKMSYFINRPELEANYHKVALAIKSQEVCFISPADDWEYPLWVYLKDKSKNSTLKHIEVQNVSKKLERKNICKQTIEMNNAKNMLKIY